MTNPEIEQPQDEALEAMRQKDDKRRKWAQLFALVCFILLSLWLAKKLPNAYPYSVEIHYKYKGMPHTEQIKRIDASLFPVKSKKEQARATYFHYDPLPELGAKTTKRQRLKLTKGKYHLKVRITYKKAAKRQMSQTIFVRESGTFYVFLRKAERILNSQAIQGGSQ